MSDSRLSALPEGPFVRLAKLLGDTKPGKDPISLAVGEPQGAVPAIIGTEDWRNAAAGWLMRRFALPAGSIDAARNVLPLNGTREGLFLGLFPFMPVTKAGGRPIVAMPNPFYQVYAAAALAAGAEPLYVAATEASGFLPDYASLPRETLDRIAAVYICSPSNPEGAVADDVYWQKLFTLAETHDFLVFADECYADIYSGEAPLGAMTARLAQSGGFTRLLSFHSLSKRSGLPGLRSGMVAGCPQAIEKFRAFRNAAVPTLPGPALAASAAD